MHFFQAHVNKAERKCQLRQTLVRNGTTQVQLTLQAAEADSSKDLVVDMWVGDNGEGG